MALGAGKPQGQLLYDPSNPSSAAFEELIKDWKGILVSEDYGVYQKWINHRQSCLAHDISRARALSESKDESIKDFGKSILKELQLLCHYAKSLTRKNGLIFIQGLSAY